MAESYCGKNCSDCEYLQSYECRGCVSGPGKEEGGTCPLAQCRKEKNLTGCKACSKRFECTSYTYREDIPRANCKGAKNQAGNMERLLKRVPALGKWLPVLFWLVLLTQVASLIDSELITQSVPWLGFAGTLLGILLGITYGVVLLQIGWIDEGYYSSGIMQIIAQAIGLVVLLIWRGNDVPGWSLILTLPQLVLGFLANFHEMTAHGNVLEGVNHDLAQKWTMLWKWYLALAVITLWSLFVVGSGNGLGVFVLLVALIGSIIVAILKMIYLYRTSQTFAMYVR